MAITWTIVNKIPMEPYDIIRPQRVNIDRFGIKSTLDLRLDYGEFLPWKYGGSIHWGLDKMIANQRNNRFLLYFVSFLYSLRIDSNLSNM